MELWYCDRCHEEGRHKFKVLTPKSKSYYLCEKCFGDYTNDLGKVLDKFMAEFFDENNQ